MTVTIVPVTTKQQREQFLRLPERLYRDDPAWIPNLYMLQREQLSESKNPFFEHGQAQLYLAFQDGQPVGRISAHVDRLSNEYHDENVAFFGFFESVDDAKVANALLETAEEWARARRFERIRGPMNFSINEEIGLIVEGFEHPPFVAMPHARPYYPSLLECAGYARAVDMFAFRWPIVRPPERTLAAAEEARKLPNIRLRKVNLWRLQRDVLTMLEIFNETWSDNWGFVPATPREARKMASDLRLIADTRIAIIAEIDGEAAGMVVGVPNLYEAIRDFRGRLNPWNALRLVWRLKVRGVKTGRLMLFGVKKKFRTRKYVGLSFLLLDELWRGSVKAGYEWSEESWVLESNTRMTSLMSYWGAEPYKRYRVYEKAL